MIPVGLEMLSQKHKVKSNSIIPAFDTELSGCDDQGTLVIPEKYKTKTTEGDYLLFLGVQNKPSAGWLAYASFCVKG